MSAHEHPAAPGQLRPNPGGVISAHDVIGRDHLIDQLWDVLEQRSVLLTGPRRLGKSCIVRRMRDFPREGFEIVYRDVESERTPADLVRWLYQDAERWLSARDRFAARARALFQAIGGSVQLQDLKFDLPGTDWRGLVRAIAADLQEHATATDRRLVLVWDEFPYFLQHLVGAGRTEDAEAVLDLLRALRQEHDRLRFVLTGSIGLHEILGVLHAHGYGNRPVNDMEQTVVDVLGHEQAVTLASALLAGIDRPDPALAARVASVCEGHPFHIHHVVQRLALEPEATPEALFDRLLRDDVDRLELRHYLDRLAQHHDGPAVDVARRVLDALAVQPEPLHPGELEDATGAEVEALREVLRWLRRDHYVRRTDHGYAFRHGYLRTFWKLERDL